MCTSGSNGVSGFSSDSERFVARRAGDAHFWRSAVMRLRSSSLRSITRLTAANAPSLWPNEHADHRVVTTTCMGKQTSDAIHAASPNKKPTSRFLYQSRAALAFGQPDSENQADIQG